MCVQAQDSFHSYGGDLIGITPQTEISHFCGQLLSSWPRETIVTHSTGSVCLYFLLLVCPFIGHNLSSVSQWSLGQCIMLNQSKKNSWKIPYSWFFCEPPYCQHKVYLIHHLEKAFKVTEGPLKAFRDHLLTAVLIVAWKRHLKRGWGHLLWRL